MAPGRSRLPVALAVGGRPQHGLWWSSIHGWGTHVVGKRRLLGRKLGNAQLGETLLPKRIALPVFASDALSSVGYAPDEIFLTLSAAVLAYYAMSWKIGIAVALVMLVVVYRQNMQAYQLEELLASHRLAHRDEATSLRS